jgi:CHAD domain-containing protein
VAEANGRSPGDYSSKLRIALEADQPAVSALRTILLDLLDTLETNVSGTVADIDSEFLHDLRVACRRTRSALTQLKGVLPERTVAPFIAEFKWLGSVTSSLRDLDVYLLEMPTYRAVLPNGAGADLDPLVAFIRKERLRARRSVSRALQSRRFRRLRTRWRDTLEGLESPPGRTATRTTADLASPRITKAYLRILKRGTGLGEDPPAEALHRLRIDAKKLRYLLEFFRSLYPRREIAARIRELKRLQDILGGFNDMEVQRDRLSSFARELRTDPAVGTSCILTLGRLAGTLERRQEEYRQAFHDAFTEFSGKPVRSAYSRLFERKGAR